MIVVQVLECKRVSFEAANAPDCSESELLTDMNGCRGFFLAFVAVATYTSGFLPLREATGFARETRRFHWGRAAVWACSACRFLRWMIEIS